MNCSGAVENRVLRATNIDNSSVSGESRWKISFNGRDLFVLKGKWEKDGKCFVEAFSEPDSNVTDACIKDYNWQLPRDFTVDLTKPVLCVKTVNSDHRGVILAVEYLGKEIFSLLGTKKGKARGGHHHPYPVKITMPMGKGEWHLKKEDEAEKIVQQSAGEAISIDENVSHYIVASEDMLLTETPQCSCVEFKAVNDAGMRNIVDDINKK